MKTPRDGATRGIWANSKDVCLCGARHVIRKPPDWQWRCVLCGIERTFANEARAFVSAGNLSELPASGPHPKTKPRALKPLNQMGPPTLPTTSVATRRASETRASYILGCKHALRVVAIAGEDGGSISDAVLLLKAMVAGLEQANARSWETPVTAKNGDDV